MSWDIFVQDLPQDAKTIEDIPSDFRGAPIGMRSDVIAKIKEVVPDADFCNPSWGHIVGPDWSIEVNIGENEVCDGFALHVRGSKGAIKAIEAILDRLQLRAIDTAAPGGFYVAGESAEASHTKWRAYRDQVAEGGK
jgi:hypothetical protein